MTPGFSESIFKRATPEHFLLQTAHDVGSSFVAAEHAPTGDNLEKTIRKILDRNFVREGPGAGRVW
jgi:hypothetical protein